ncbi:MAG: DUF4143 domain-containing protein, partial [Proteobacteria bacterium]|nr:DUF4143 domain-containing protein [Pseudomonadota bacterium]
MDYVARELERTLERAARAFPAVVLTGPRRAGQWLLPFSKWLGVLETTAQILIVPPYYENLGKRLVKSPRMYVADSALAAHLLGIRSPEEFERSPFRGVSFEGFIASEIAKAQANRGD